MLTKILSRGQMMSPTCDLCQSRVSPGQKFNTLYRLDADNTYADTFPIAFGYKEPMACVMWVLNAHIRYGNAFCADCAAWRLRFRSCAMA